MKHSIFLFLLFLAFSTLVDFEIIMKPGIQLWEISDNFNEISKYERFDLPNKSSVSSNIDSSEESYLRIQPGVSELDIVQQRMNTYNTFEQQRMDTHNTYIIVGMNEYGNVSIYYYWVGAQSSEEKRINAAHLVGDMFMKINKEIPRKNLKKFHREAEGRESVSFLQMLYKVNGRIDQRLYRVAGTEGQFIMEVPLTPSQLNGSDSFVLHRGGSIFIWHSLHSNQYIRCKANFFSKYILKMKYKKKHLVKPRMWVTEGFTDRESDLYKSFTQEFFKNLKGNAEEKRFPDTPYYYTDEDLKNKRREDVKLYTFSYSRHDFTPYEVPYRDLKLSNLGEKAAYVLADLICGNIFVIFGRWAGLMLVKKSLLFAETLSGSIQVEDAWQRVRIILLDKDLPLYFQIYFSDIFRWQQLKICQ